VNVELAERFEALIPAGEVKRGGWRNAEIERALEHWLNWKPGLKPRIKARTKSGLTPEPEATGEEYELWRNIY
jgi:hypothetical protein